MEKGKRLGLDELMIINPGLQNPGAIFLGDDGTLYQVTGLSEEELDGLGEYFIGDDDALYKVERSEQGTTKEQAKSSSRVLSEDQRRDIGRFFLGDDGTLYEVANSSPQR